MHGLAYAACLGQSGAGGTFTSRDAKPYGLESCFGTSLFLSLSFLFLYIYIYIYKLYIRTHFVHKTLHSIYLCLYMYMYIMYTIHVYISLCMYAYTHIYYIYMRASVRNVTSISVNFYLDCTLSFNICMYFAHACVVCYRYISISISISIYICLIFVYMILLYV